MLPGSPSAVPEHMRLNHSQSPCDWPMFDAFERPTKRAERIVNMKFVETSAETLEAASRKFPADDVAIVEYPSFNALRKVVENPQYAAKAAPHR